MKTTQCLIVSLIAVCVTGVQGYGRGPFAGGLVRIRPKLRPRAPITNAGKARGASLKRIRPILDTVESKDGCPKRFVRYRDSCFSHNLASRTWESARLACRRKSHNADLASINSKEELDFIQNRFGGGKNDLSWIGLHKDRPGTPYTWANGDTVQYLPWVPNYIGQEPTGYVALSLVDLHFIPETSPNKVLPSLCRAARRSPGVDANQTVEGGKGGAGGELNEKQHPPKIHTKCREGWDSFEGKCYKAFDEKMTHSDATASCKKEGANLLSLHSPRESEFVRTHVMREKWPVEFYWIGLSNGKNGLRWSDGSPLDYTNWLPGMPIKAQGGKSARIKADRNLLERCYKIDSEAFMWEPEGANEFCYFVCIKEDEADFYFPPTTPGPTTQQTTVQTSSTFLPPGFWDDIKKALLELGVLALPLNGSSANIRLDADVFKEIQISDDKKQVVDKLGALLSELNDSSINTRLNPDILGQNQKSSAEESESESDSHQIVVAVFVTLIGSVVLLVAVIGAISWRRRYGNFQDRWRTLQESLSYENTLYSVKQSLRDHGRQPSPRPDNGLHNLPQKCSGPEGNSLPSPDTPELRVLTDQKLELGKQKVAVEENTLIKKDKRASKDSKSWLQ
ncbi:hypothetical protein RRG08_001214 [Elysia crispata]|uniref:C-type lectin domain-containing protein n=1 Tax=Elysia crispata TaxID=231223 RepID=A0AAE1B8Q6_9GAST|nr:hypothetical protein RRG08_001214 [Elysia crispata]